MAIRRPPTTFSDSITGADLASDIAISTTGNIATTGSGTLTSAGAFTASGGIANAGTITAGTIGSAVTGFTGIKVLDTWELTTGFTATADPIQNNLSRYTNFIEKKINEKIREINN